MAALSDFFLSDLPTLEMIKPEIGIKIKTKKMKRKTNILCIHINFTQKTENFIKIHMLKKIIDNKKNNQYLSS